MGAGRYAQRLSETEREKQLEVKKWWKEKKISPENKEISCEIRSRVDEPLRFVGSLSRDKRNEKEKNNPQNIPGNLNGGTNFPSASAPMLVGRRVFWPLKHYTDD